MSESHLASCVGKTRHTDTQELRLHSARRNRELEVQKDAGEETVVDMLTRIVKSKLLEKHLAEMGFVAATRREMDDELLAQNDHRGAQTRTLGRPWP